MSFFRKAFASLLFLRPPGVCLWSPDHTSRQVAGVLATEAASSIIAMRYLDCPEGTFSWKIRQLLEDNSAGKTLQLCRFWHDLFGESPPLLGLCCESKLPSDVWGRKKTRWPAWTSCPARHPKFDSLSQTLRSFFLALNYPPSYLPDPSSTCGLRSCSILSWGPSILEFFHSRLHVPGWTSVSSSLFSDSYTSVSSAPCYC